MSLDHKLKKSHPVVEAINDYTPEGLNTFGKISYYTAQLSNIALTGSFIGKTIDVPYATEAIYTSFLTTVLGVGVTVYQMIKYNQALEDKKSKTLENTLEEHITKYTVSKFKNHIDDQKRNYTSN